VKEIRVRFRPNLLNRVW